MKPIPIDEQETVITISPPQVSQTAEVYTCMPNMMKKLRDQAASRPDCIRINKDLGNALFAEVDRSCIKITPKRKMSEADRIAAVERLVKWRFGNDAT